METFADQRLERLIEEGDLSIISHRHSRGARINQLTKELAGALVRLVYDEAFLVDLLEDGEDDGGVEDGHHEACQEREGTEVGHPRMHRLNTKAEFEGVPEDSKDELGADDFEKHDPVAHDKHV